MYGFNRLIGLNSSMNKTPKLNVTAKISSKIPNVKAVKPVNIQGQMSALAGPVLRKLYLSQRRMDRVMNPLAVNQPQSNPISPKSIL